MLVSPPDAGLTEMLVSPRCWSHRDASLTEMLVSSPDAGLTKMLVSHPDAGLGERWCLSTKSRPWNLRGLASPAAAAMNC